MFNRSDWGAITVRAAAVPFSFLGQLVAARALGTAGYGSWQALLALLDLLGYAAKLGLDVTGVRLASEYQATSQWARLRGLQRTFLGSAFISGVAVAGAWWALTAVTGKGWDDQIVLFACLLLILNVLLEVAVGLLRGQGFAVLSAVMFHLVRHVGPLVLFSYALARTSGVPAITSAVQSQIATTLFALAVLLFLLPRSIPAAQRRECSYARREWLRVSFPLWIVSACIIVQQNAGLLIVQREALPAAAGVFAVALRLANFVGIGTLMVGITFAPRLAHAHALQRHHEFNRLVLTSTLFAISVGAVVAGGEWLFAPELFQLMGVLAGDDLAVFHLLILAALFQCVGQAALQGLLMSGAPRRAAVIQMSLTLISVATIAIGVRYDGIRGAAYAVMVTALLSQPLWIVVLYRRQAKMTDSV